MSTPSAPCLPRKAILVFSRSLLKMSKQQASAVASEGRDGNEPALRGSSAPFARPVPSRRHVLLLGLLLFLVYNSNLRTIHIDDSVPARLLPFSLLIDHSFYLDRWVGPYLAAAKGPYKAYFVVPWRGHLISFYPVVMPVLLTPIYGAPAWWVAHQQPPLDPGDPVFGVIVDTWEKLCASLIATLSALVLFAGLKRALSVEASLALALIYGLASSTWTISSQALWKHGFTELCLATLLWALLRGPEWRWQPVAAGLALGMAAAAKYPDAVIALPFLVYFFKQGRERGWRRLHAFLSPLVVLGSVTLAYNLYFFGNPLGTTLGMLRTPDPQSPVPHDAPWISLAGLLVSPNRGLIVYTPWVVFALWGAARIWKDNTYGWGRYIIVGMATMLLGYVKYSSWWAGWCFGPRYLTDLMPLLAFFLVPIWPRLRRRLMLATFSLAVAASLGVQTIGAFCYRDRLGSWDSSPVSVDLNPRRVWDWRDTQISRSLRSGLASPDLYYGWFLLASDVTGPTRAQPNVIR